MGGRGGLNLLLAVPHQVIHATRVSVSRRQQDKNWNKHREVKFKVYIQIEWAKNFWNPSARGGSANHSCNAVTKTDGKTVSGRQV